MNRLTFFIRIFSHSKHKLCFVKLQNLFPDSLKNDGMQKRYHFMNFNKEVSSGQVWPWLTGQAIIIPNCPDIDRSSQNEKIPIPRYDDLFSVYCLHIIPYFRHALHLCITFGHRMKNGKLWMKHEIAKASNEGSKFALKAPFVLAESLWGHISLEAPKVRRNF